MKAERLCFNRDLVHKGPGCCSLKSVTVRTWKILQFTVADPLILGGGLLYSAKSQLTTRRRDALPVHTHTAQSDTDVLLLRRVASKETSAISELYDLHSAILYTVILRIVSNEAEAEDVLQEVFLRVWDRAGTYNPELSAPLVWLTRVARNLAIDRLRSKVFRARDREVELDAHLELGDGGETNPERFAMLSQEQRAVAAAMASLPTDQRVLIEQAFFQGYTQSELAAHFKIPLGTVKTRIRSGMSSLRRQLQYLI
jgi:RNA polymerase sigma-70 factor (ECF subfamily)